MDNDTIKLVFLLLYTYLTVQPQAQLIKYLGHLFPVLMLTSNIVSNHRVILICKMYFQTYPEGLQIVGFKQISGYLFQPRVI